MSDGATTKSIQWRRLCYEEFEIQVDAWVGAVLRTAPMLIVAGWMRDIRPDAFSPLIRRFAEQCFRR